MKFNTKEGYADRPVTIACGQCDGCRESRAHSWATRIYHEAQLHQRNAFVTLTYDDEHLPANGSLDKKHHQDFMKRLRRRYDAPLRYFMVGEYGERLGRPHYHYCLFGIDFHEDRKFLRNTAKGHRIWESPTLTETWSKGFANFGELTYASALYTARYCLKKVTGDQADEHYDGRIPEFTTMSRKPGIASEWIAKYGREVFTRDSVIVNGRRRQPPKFYDAFLENHYPADFKKTKGKRKRAANKHADNNTHERLKVRERVQRRKREHFGSREYEKS